jgi:hypothetical protein
MIGTGEKLACLARELVLRRNTYRKLVAAGRMKQENADREIAIIEAIIADYEEKDYDASRRPV